MIYFTSILWFPSDRQHIHYFKRVPVSNSRRIMFCFYLIGAKINIDTADAPNINREVVASLLILGRGGDKKNERSYK
jgi:hypothetical protein